ncbi:MAG: recombinase family protein, partial [Phycisphaerae bacterium]|nr:recombinase family protein [Phycisphaerae bacterium]
MIADLQIKRTKSSQAATKRCGLYIRVSTEMQTDGNSLSTQKTRLHQYVAQRKWTVGKVFTEAGLSAKNTRRPALQHMLRWARDGKIDVVLVDKVDRISRNLVDLLNLIGDLRIWGVAFVSASQSFDTSTSAGNLMLNVLGSVAQFEREIIGDRVRENMLERARKGLWSGGIVPFGYETNPGTKVLRAEKSEARTVRAIFNEFLKTRSLSSTCHNINSAGRVTRRGKAWSFSSIKRILSSSTYIGTLCYGKRRMRGDHLLQNGKDNWIIVPNAHPAIVSKKDFKKVQAILSKNSSTKPWSCSTLYLLSGLGRCGACGSRIMRYCQMLC